jgi:uncharacterized membrane protein YkoI
MKRTILVAAVIAASATLCTIKAQEKKLTREQLPAAVQKTVSRESEGATVKGFSTEVEGGVRLFEAELEVNGRSKDISMNSKGEVVEVEEQVDLDSLPDAVKNALTKAAGNGTIRKVESLTKRGKLVAYEAAIADGKKHREVQVGPNGEKLAREQ